MAVQVCLDGHWINEPDGIGHVGDLVRVWGAGSQRGFKGLIDLFARIGRQLVRADDPVVTLIDAIHAPQ